MALQSDIVRFVSAPFNRLLVLSLLAIGLALLLYSPIGGQEISKFNEVQDAKNATLTVDFFYSPSCPHCRAQHDFNARLSAEFPNVAIVAHNVEDEEEAALMEFMSVMEGMPDEYLYSVPKTFVGKYLFVGYDNEYGRGEEIRQAIISELSGLNQTQNAGNESAPPAIDLPFIGTVEPAKMSLPVLAIVLGLVDGFNPCAMWVLVYLISIVISMKDRKRLWIIVGSFVLASGILYFLFMTAWLNAFLFIGYFRPVTIAVGLFALGAGILALKEFAQNPQGTLECKVGDASGKKKTMGTIDALVNSPISIATIGGVIVLAFAINSVEFACSAGIPAVFTQVLALSSVGALEHYAYILLYVVFFMLDDAIIFGLAAMAVSTEFGQKYAGYCHVIGGAVMFGLGVMLLFFPNVLA